MSMSEKEKSQTSAYRFCRIDVSDDADALLEQIKIILREGDSHNADVFTDKLWRWQYRDLPTKQSLIYVAYNNSDKIVGYYHVPVYQGRIHGWEKKFAMVQDVAMSASERGRGLFRQLACYANDDMLNHDIDIAYTFPNNKSIHTFIKYNGYHKVAVYDTYLMPVKTSLLIKAKTKNPLFVFAGSAMLRLYSSFTRAKSFPKEKLLISEKITEELSEFYDRFAKPFTFHLQKDFDYMNWRYQSKPTAVHSIISVREGNRITASAIFKTDEMLGAQALLMMDFAFEREDDMMRLIHTVRKNAKEIFGKDIAMIFTAFNCHTFLKKKRSGFIRIPERFNPRPLNLLVRKLKYQDDDCFDKNNWLATLTDWDVF